MELSCIELMQFKGGSEWKVEAILHIEELNNNSAPQVLLLLGHEIKVDEVVGSCSMDAINKEHKKFTVCCRE